MKFLPYALMLLSGCDIETIVISDVDSGIPYTAAVSDFGCKSGTTSCISSNLIMLCRYGIWVEENCDTLCAKQENGYVVGCGQANGSDACFCVEYGKFGDLCSDSKLCGAGLSCIFGMCTRHCCFGSGKGMECGLLPCPSDFSCEFEVCVPL